MTTTNSSREADKNSHPDGVLADSLGGGPLGLGDPDDKSLRKVEREILIPQKMKEKAKKTVCAKPIIAFGECAKEQGLMMPFRCRALAKELEHCLRTTYSDQAFVDLCTKEFIEERSYYRRTGIKAKAKKKEIVLG